MKGSEQKDSATVRGRTAEGGHTERETIPLRGSVLTSGLDNQPDSTVSGERTI